MGDKAQSLCISKKKKHHSAGMWIDTHCHMEKVLCADGAQAWLEGMERAGVGRCIVVGTDIDDWQPYYRLAGQHRGKVDWTVGLHPCSVDSGWADPVAAIASYFGTEPQPVALGEIGLDYFHLPKYPDEAAEVKALQQAAFREQLTLAYQLGCPVVIHSRSAVEACIEMIDSSGVDWNKVVFHCYTDGPELLRQINARGGRASFTGIVTYKAKSADPIRAALVEQGVERLMLETDAPYLAPEPVRGEPNEPANVAHIGRYVAQMLGMDTAELAALTSANARAFYQLCS
jgi:TatD DNase family protein